LTGEQRKEAALISQTLFESRDKKSDYPVQSLKSWVIEKINAVTGFRLEYFDLVDGFTLQSIQNWEDTEYPVGCIAVFVGEVRLIDNIHY
jgi:pantoate--beta-alanine ligase